MRDSASPGLPHRGSPWVGHVLREGPSQTALLVLTVAPPLSPLHPWGSAPPVLLVPRLGGQVRGEPPSVTQCEDSDSTR